MITTGFPRLEEDRDTSLRTAGDGAVLVLRPGVTGMPPTSWVEAPLPS